MVWTALCAGLAIFVILSRVAGGMRRVCPDIASGALRMIGASGMFALAIATVADGTLVASTVAAVCGAALTLDLLALWRRASVRISRAGHGSTVTPFQNAT